jgi:hypothetical protein
MKWNDFKSVNIVERLFNLSYFEYDLYSYNQIVKSTTGEDTILKRVGNRLDNYGSKMYYEYNRDINNKLFLRNKYAEYFDEFKNLKLFYFRAYDPLLNTWTGMSGRLSQNEYNVNQTIKSFTTGNIYGDSAFFYFDRIDYFDYVDAVLSFNNIKNENTHVYPNPFTNTLHINNNFLNIESVEIINQLGKRVIYLTNVEDRSIDTGCLDPGLYTLKLKIGNDVHFQKIVKY